MRVKVWMSLIVAFTTLSSEASLAQQQNTALAAFGINVATEDVLGQGPTQAEYWTDSEVTFEARGLPYQFVAVMVGEYFPEAFAYGPLVVDLHLPTISVVMNGFTSLDPTETIGASGIASRTLIFPGSMNAADASAAMQAVVGDPTSIFGIRTTAACRMVLRSGFEDLPLQDDDSIFVPFRSDFTFDFYGQSYTGVWVSSNGYINFEGPETMASPTASGFLTGEGRIAAFFTDLVPDPAGPSSITTHQYVEGEEWCFRVDFSQVPGKSAPTSSHSASIVLRQSGVIGIGIHNDTDAPVLDLLVGISAGSSLDTTTVSSDLSSRSGSFEFLGPFKAAYEVFDHGNPQGPTNYLDLDGAWTYFYPDGQGASFSGYFIY